MSASTNIVWHHGEVSRQDRANNHHHAGCTVWLTGLSGSGKSTIAVAAERILVNAGAASYRLDGDNVRHGLNADLSFAPDDRVENIRRFSETARLFADAGLITLVSVISPYEADRERARTIHQQIELPFIEVFVNTPIDICEQRDPKGLYKKARAGEIKDFTGVNAPYEAPTAAELELTPSHGSPDEQAMVLIEHLKKAGVILPSSSLSN